MRTVKTKIYLGCGAGSVPGPVGNPGQAGAWTSREEAALFSLGDLGAVDLSPRR